MMNTTSPRFGQVLTQPVGVFGNYLELTVSGKEDIESVKPLIDKFGFKLPNSPAEDPAYRIDIQKQPEGYEDNAPEVLKLKGDTLPTVDEIGDLLTLLQKAEPQPGTYNPNGLFERHISGMQNALLNTTTYLLKKKGGDTAKMIQTMLTLLKQG